MGDWGQSYASGVANARLPVLGSALTVASITWVANHAVYIPMNITYPYPVRRVFWFNGSTVTTTNADFGIYNEDGTKIYSTGSTAISGANQAQYVTPGTAFTLSPGTYYFAYTCSGTTSRAYGSTTLTATLMRHGGILQQGTALPLPATATFASPTQALIPFCGVTRFASGF